MNDELIARVARALEPYLDSSLTSSARRQAPLDVLAALEPGDVLGGGLSVEKPLPGGIRSHVSVAKIEAAEAMRERAADAVRRACTQCDGMGRSNSLGAECKYCGEKIAAIRNLEVK